MLVLDRARYMFILRGGQHGIGGYDTVGGTGMVIHEGEEQFAA